MSSHGASRLLILIVLLGVAPWVSADPLITEFMASNKTTLKDEDGDYSDWIEIYNPDATAVNLSGWYLTDNASKKTKWKMPAVTLASKTYLIVFASSKDRSDPTKTLHTNFSLDKDGEFLGMYKPDGTTATSDFGPKFPPQSDDISYGVAQTAAGAPTSTIGYFGTPTPGAQNPDASGITLLEKVSFSQPAGLFKGGLTVSLSGATGSERIRYVIVDPGSANAAAREPVATDPLYTAPLSITSSVVIRAAVFSSDDTQHGISSLVQYVAYDGATPNRVDTFTSELPVIVLDQHGGGLLSKDGVDHPAWFYFFTPESNGLTSLIGTPSFASAGTMSVRGNFSSNFPKRSYNLTFLDAQGHNNPQTLIDTESDEDWALVGPWATDRSYLRNAYVYTLSNQIGRWAPRTRFVEMFVDNNGDGLDANDYAGIGVLTDRIQIDKDRLNITSMSASDTDITGGYIVKIDNVPDTTHYTFITNHGVPAHADTAVVIDTPKLSKITPAQQTYIQNYLQQMEDAMVADKAANYATRTYLNYIDLSSWVDHHVLELFVGNVDALYRSDYFYKDRGGKLFSGPAWDFDSTMGSGDARNERFDTWSTAGDVDLWNYGWFGLITHDPEFMQAWIDRWQTLRLTTFADDNLTSLADNLAGQVGRDAAARDAAKWPDDVSTYGSFVGEIDHIKSWITQRAAWIDSQFVAPPTLALDGTTLRVTPASGTQLAYTLDGSDPRAVGGALSPTATVTSNPLALSASANLKVRSYAPARNVFPGSAWSGPHSAADAAPIAPQDRPRLVNVSARAFVGPGESVLISGFVVRDANDKPFLARAVGPGLGAFGVTDAIPDPILRVVKQDGTEITTNQGWDSTTDAALISSTSSAVGAFPLVAGSKDAAAIAKLSSGVYSLQVTSASAKSGTGFVELYETDSNGSVVNLSARSTVRPNGAPLIAGFVVGGHAPKRVLIRGVGPTLTNYGVTTPLPDPVITLYSGSTAIASNNDWGSATNPNAIANAANQTGAFALTAGSKDAAILITLNPGLYSVIVSSRDQQSGTALVEIYDVR